jgi:hypothetical protein
MRFCGRPHLGWFYICPDIVLYQKEEEKGNSTKGVLTKPVSCISKKPSLTWVELLIPTTSDGMQWLKMAGLDQSALSNVSRISYH